MDTLTHALSGALIARTAWRREAPASVRARSLAACAAAAFPDIDYVLFWLAPLDFLSLHRSITHSLVLLPLWAAILAAMLGRLLRQPWRVLYLPCAVGLAAHIAGDVVTIYGTQVLWPLSVAPLALNLSFDVNPWTAAIVFLGAAAALRRPLPALAIAGAALAGLLVLQAALRTQALAVARSSAAPEALLVDALPQPLSPFHWLLIVREGEDYRIAHLDLLRHDTAAAPASDTWLARFAVDYRPADDLRWTRYYRFGATAEEQASGREAWEHVLALHRYARLPALYRVDRRGSEVCVWFTDLRHILPALPPSFRYGVCRDAPELPWMTYRLRYFSLDEREAL